MRACLLLLLLLFVPPAFSQEIPADTVHVQKKRSRNAMVAPMDTTRRINRYMPNTLTITRISSDTFLLDSALFLRIPAPTPAPYSIELDSIAFSIVKKNGQALPFNFSMLSVTEMINGVVVGLLCPNSNPIRRGNDVVSLIKNMPPGRVVSFDAQFLFDKQGKIVSLKHEPLVLRKL